MQILAFVIALIGSAVFVAEYVRSKSLMALGLVFVTIAIVVQMVWQNGSVVVIH